MTTSEPAGVVPVLEAAARKHRHGALALITPLGAQHLVAEALGISTATARKRVQQAVKDRELTKIGPGADWEITLPGGNPGGLKLFAHRDSQFLVRTEPPRGRQPVESSAFVTPPGQLADLVHAFTAEAEAIAAKKEA